MRSEDGEFRLVLLATTDQSDLFFANQLAQRLNVAAIFVETQASEAPPKPLAKRLWGLVSDPRRLPSRLYNKLAHTTWRQYGDHRKPQYRTDFGPEGRELFPPKNCEVVTTEGPRDINKPKYVSRLRSVRPDLVAVCGASILREEFLSVPRHGVLNLHGGLVQRYRGLFTTDWAVHNDEPEYVGATVHFVSSGIDDGDIVYQGRPDICDKDNPSTLYEKVVHLGVDMMEQAIRDVISGRIKRTPLTEKGDLYLEREFTEAALIRTWRQWRRGTIGSYLADKASRDQVVQSQLVNDFDSR